MTLVELLLPISFVRRCFPPLPLGATDFNLYSPRLPELWIGGLVSSLHAPSYPKWDSRRCDRLRPRDDDVLPLATVPRLSTQA